MPTADSRQSTGDWQQVWECPRCGVQFAMGVDLPDAPKATVSRPNCSMGHAPVEMEQKLARAMPFGPGEVRP